MFGWFCCRDAIRLCAMFISPAFLEVANESIKEEIRTYFPDTALYRRLSWGGIHGCDAYLQQEFSPASFLLPHLNDTVAGAKGLNSFPSPSLTPKSRKRRRNSLVAELERGIQSVEAMYPSNGHARRVRSMEAPCTVVTGGDIQAAVTEPAARHTTLEDAPYRVECTTCTTHIVSSYPCRVLKGYVVLWAQSTLTVQCVPVPHATRRPASLTWGGCEDTREGSAEGFVAATQLRNIEDLKNNVGVQRLLSRTEAPTADLEDVLATLSPLLEILNSFPTSDRETEARSMTAQQTQQTVLLSLHIVNADAVVHRRPASFALQSVLLPGLPTVLECYPRHMVHFGLLVYAAWHASLEVWANTVLGGEEEEEEDNHPKAAKPCTERNGSRRKGISRGRSSSANTSASLADLLPHTADDAVLILGLGGNVLGRCLDTVLAPAVPLHIVEVEPAVLQACEALHQFPSSTGEAVKNAEAPITTAPAKVLRRGKGGKTPPLAQATEQSDEWWSRAAELVHEKSGSCVAFSSLRQQPCSGGGVGEKRGAGSATRCSLPTAASKPRRGGGSAATSQRAQMQQGSSTNARGAYVCYLQDAYAFLRGAAEAHPTKVIPSPVAAATHKAMSQRLEDSNNAASPALDSTSTLAAQESVASVITPSPVQYRMIFLDCYDPDREHMMHEGGLIDLCLRRLQPGGVLLVNAHVLPTVEALKRDFLTRGFATVQALRVSGCTQTVLACIAPDNKTEQHLGKEKCARFTVSALRQLAHRLNRHLASAESASDAALRSNFRIDGSWLKSCRRIAVPHPKGTPAKGSGGGKTASVDAPTEFRVWQHYA